MSSKFLVVGSHSFIAQHWLATAGQHLGAVPHNGLSSIKVGDFEVIVNCAVSPEAKCSAYSEANDFDLIAARRAADHGKHFVMLSTRKVYRQSIDAVTLDECSPLDPADHYGANKLESETRVRALLGERCTILRISNVYGYEIGRHSFFGLALTRLKGEQRIVLDVSPFVERDFIAVETLSVLLSKICELRPPGTFNLGSGTGLPLGRVAQWLIQGYGQGRLEVNNIDERDAFIMNNTKLRSALGVFEVPNNFEFHIKNLGRKLIDE